DDLDGDVSHQCASMWNCSNRPRSSSGGTSLLSDMIGVAEKLSGSTSHATSVDPVSPGSPRSPCLPATPRPPFGPGFPGRPAEAMSCQSGPGQAPGLSVRATKLEPLSATTSNWR